MNGPGLGLQAPEDRPAGAMTGCKSGENSVFASRHKDLTKLKTVQIAVIVTG